MSRISSLLPLVRRLAKDVARLAVAIWVLYRSLARWLQIVIALILILALFGLSKLGSGDAPVDEEAALPTVRVERIDALAGNGSSVTIIGSVRSVTEASVLAQSSGTVTAVHTSTGSYVGAGALLVELDNASQRATVLQAEGAYEAALAARSGASPTDIASSARNTYTTAYSTIDTLLKSDIDLFFGASGGIGPQFLIGSSPFDAPYFPKKRSAITDVMNAWRDHLPTAGSADPAALLGEAETVVKLATALANDIAQAATKNNTDATATQLAALATARAGFTSVQSAVTGAKLAYQGQNTSATAGADASVKIALGSLHAAQAQLEKTYVRAPIAGTINFLPLRVGDYVSSMTHVATVAQNGALEIVAYLSEESRGALSTGAKVNVEDSYPAIITSIAPALDPVTKQIEMHLALTGTSTLVNGQSVRISLPSSAPTTSITTGPLLLPLTALKLTPSARVVFSVSEEGRLVAHEVTIGDVRGDRIEINTELPADLRIVTDARGFSEGQKVTTVTTP